MTSGYLYSDLNRFDSRKRPLVYDRESVARSVQRCITKPPRQALFRPRGAPIDRLLFELDADSNSSRGLLFRIKNTTFASIQQDTRVYLDYARTTLAADPPNNTYAVQAVFIVKGFAKNAYQRASFPLTYTLRPTGVTG